MSAGAHLARLVVGRMPPRLADLLRRRLAPGGDGPGTVLRWLNRGGIPRRVTTFRLLDDPDLVFTAADSQVLGQLYWWGGTAGWEPELLPLWRTFCREARSVLELGANVGYFTVQGGRAIGAGARYVAVEPHPVSAEVCRANLALNGVSTVDVVGAAAVAAPGRTSVPLLVPADQQATPTIAYLPADTELPADLARGAVPVTEVPAVDVRRLLPGVDLLKLDVEGQEHALLAAARDHLRAHRPTVFVEVLPGTVRLRALLADLCTTDGYRCYALGREGPVELRPDELGTIRLMDVFGCQDVLLCATDLPST